MRERRTAGLIIGVGLVAVVLILLPHFVYRGRVLPRVESNGLSVGGMRAEQVATALAANSQNLAQSTRLTVVNPVTRMTWTHTAAELGGAPDVEATSQKLLSEGRSGILGSTVGPWLTILRGPTVNPVWSFAPDPSPSLEAIFGASTVAPTNARLEMREGRQVAVPATPGRAVDAAATAAAFAEALEQGSPSAELHFEQTGARIASLEDVATAWDTIMSSPLRVTFEGDVLFEVGLDELGQWFSLQDMPTSEGDVRPTIVVNRDAILERVIPLAPLIEREPEDTRFVLDPIKRTASVLRPGQDGASLDVEGTVNRVIEGAYARQRVAEVAATLTPARIQPEDAAELDGALPVAAAYISLLASPAERTANGRLAAEALAGIALAPGQELSVLRSLGEVSAARGYATAFLRPQPDAPPGWTGGLEQAVSTLYRAAMWAGLLVSERHQVPFRVGWLEPPVGLDATVQGPDTDLVIVNPTESFLLFESGIDEGRNSTVVTVLASPPFTPTVEIGGPLVKDVTPPGEESTIADPALPVGARVQVGWSREGASAHVIRTVVMPDAGVLTDELESLYVPARKVTAVGSRR